jgi:aspartyl-tRNA(Asn)/glutamyl-tRNA(Gln) amidotransferase subunit B
MEYETVIGLEVHVELLTESKLFCSCPNRFAAEPNVNTCPGCLGFPGVLPQLNAAAVQKALTAALALNCEIALFSYFDRKNYFYPDLSKGYQISQFHVPIGSNGYLDLEDDQGSIKRVRIGRVHMEEDAGKLVHSPAGDTSLVDYNRAGVPLIEVVTEPDLRTPGEAKRYLEKLKSILQYARVSDCKMEEGSLRCDANISLRPVGSNTLGSKTELKNMNSFKAVEKSLEHEIKRQRAILKSGQEVVTQTLRWEENTQETIVMRGKLQAHDYRCFVDPELSPVQLTTAAVEAARANLPEMAEARAARFVKAYNLPGYDAAILTASRSLADYFEACLADYDNPKVAGNWIMGELTAKLNSAGIEADSCSFTPLFMADLLQMIDEGLISGKLAKEILDQSFASGKSPRQIVAVENLTQISDHGELDKVIRLVIEEHPDSVENYRGGKTKALGFLVGQVMKETRGKANPQLVNELLLEALDN